VEGSGPWGERNAKQLVDIAIEAHAQKFGIERETAERWIHDAMGG